MPVVRTLRRNWPRISLTWIIGTAEHALLDGLEGVEFVVYDKRSGLSGLRRLWRSFRGRRFDVLLQMQRAARANLLALGVPAAVRVGYDRGRSKEGHGLGINRRIEPGGRHVVDVLGRFPEALGLRQEQVEWNLPVPAEARDWAARQLPDGPPVLIVSPCSSHRLRDWLPERYAAVADHAARAHGWRVAICGGRGARERAMADAIGAAMRTPALDLVGKDTLKRMLGLFERAGAVLAPDSGPAHIANALGTPVLGLYACTDAERSGPYSDLRWTVNRYDAAARRFLGSPGTALPWGKRVEFEGAMALIETAAVIERLDALAAWRRAGAAGGESGVRS